jgi:hypothetical protein
MLSYNFQRAFNSNVNPLPSASDSDTPNRKF